MVHTIDLDYDDIGRLTAASDAFSSYAMAYSVEGTNQQIVTDNAGTPGVPHVVLTTLFDGQGRLLQASDVDLEFDVQASTLTEGSAAVNEVQRVAVSGSAVGPAFSLSFDSQTTPLLETSASAAAIETALEALATIGAGNVSVTGAAGGPWTIEFTGDLALQDVPAVTVNRGHARCGERLRGTVRPESGGGQSSDRLARRRERPGHTTVAPLARLRWPGCP